MKTFRNLVHATLLGAVTLPLLLVPSFAQQEVDPTWHDPWAVTMPTPPNAAKQVAEKPVSAHRVTAKAATPQASAHKKQVAKQEPPAAIEPGVELAKK
jgi:hypothetical protein